MDSGSVRIRQNSRVVKAPKKTRSCVLTLKVLMGSGLCDEWRAAVDCSHLCTHFLARLMTVSSGVVTDGYPEKSHDGGFDAFMDPKCWLRDGFSVAVAFVSCI